MYLSKYDVKTCQRLKSRSKANRLLAWKKEKTVREKDAMVDSRYISYTGDNLALC